MIQAHNLTKRFGSKLAVDDLSFEIRPGVVTGLLGPNGAGKSTTMRMIVGLDTPTSGDVTVNGVAYARLPYPMRTVGALLDGKAVDGRRTAHQHLRWLAVAGAVPQSRIDEVLGLVGLSDVASRRIGGFSLGMSQRLGLASALLGDPEILVLDEPVNGLDPEGILWIRTLMRSLADEGRTVVVSSHLMSEMERTADHVLVIGRGRLVADTTINKFVSGGTLLDVHVRTPEWSRLTGILTAAGAQVTNRDDVLEVTGIDNVEIARLAAEHGILLHELMPRHQNLEARFMELTHDSVDFRPQGGDEQ